MNWKNRTIHRSVAALALLLAVLGLVLPGAAAQEARLGGGSDIPAGTVVEVAAGTVIPPVHHVFADNPEAEPIEVEFRAVAPAGIEVTSDQVRYTIAPGESVRVPFSVSVGEVVAADDYDVTVQLVRSDIVSQPGEVTNIPAVGTTFTISVVGDAATITVLAQSEQSGRPVSGTLTLAAITGPEAMFEVARADGSELSARVAPGEYRATYLLDGRELAAAEATVTGGASEEIVLEVRSVSFVVVSAQPVREEGTVVVAELVASVENHLRELDGPVVLRAVVRRDGRDVDSLVLEEMDRLTVGVTESTMTYRPPEGFAEGTYEFVFSLDSPELSLAAVDRPGFDVGGTESFPVAAAAAVAAGVIVLGGAGWRVLRRPSRPSGRHSQRR